MREKQSPQFSFDDQTIYLTPNGKVSLTPSQMDLLALRYNELSPKKSGKTKNKLEENLRNLIKGSDVIAEEIQSTINEFIVPKAKQLWALQETFKRKFPTPTEQDSAPFKSLVYEIYTCNNPDQFPNLLKNHTVGKSAFAEEFYATQSHLLTYAPDDFIKKEVLLWLKKQGFENIPISGHVRDNNRIFSDSDTASLSALIKTELTEKCADIDSLIVEMRTKIPEKDEQFTAMKANENLANELLELPKRSNPKLSILFDLALQDNTFSVSFFAGNSYTKIYPIYGSAGNYGAYDRRFIMAYLPKDEYSKKKTTISAQRGHALEGGFSTINDLEITPQDMYIRSDAWEEELLHRAMHRLFENECRPFDPDDASEKKFYAALAADLKINSPIIQDIKNYMGAPTAKNGADLLPYLDPSSRQFNAIAFHSAATESIVKVARIFNKRGQKEARGIAPNLTKYLEEVVLKRAHEKCGKWGVQLTSPPEPDRLKHKPLPGNRGPDAGNAGFKHPH